MKKYTPQMEEMQKMADDLGDMQKFVSYAKKEGEIELYMCGSCEKKITLNQIASWGNDHHDPDQMMCEDCFADACDRADAYAYSLKEEV